MEDANVKLFLEGVDMNLDLPIRHSSAVRSGKLDGVGRNDEAVVHGTQLAFADEVETTSSVNQPTNASLWQHSVIIAEA